MLTGIILSATAVFVIDGRLKIGAAFVATGAVFTFFGLMHSRELGIGQSPVLVASYLIVAAMLLAAARGRRASAPPLAAEVGNDQQAAA